MFKGKKMTLGEREFVVPALSLGQLRNGGVELLRQHDETSAKGQGFDAMELRGKLIHLALQRNYPDLTEEDVFGLLDMANTGEVWQTVLGLSGFTSGEVSAAQIPVPVPVTPGT